LNEAGLVLTTPETRKFRDIEVIAALQ